MTDAYRTETQEHNGSTYRIEWFYDHDVGAPWDEHDGHGSVSDWTTRDKRPGELVLSQDRSRKRFYDFQAAVQEARQDGWNTEPYNWPSKGAQAVAAVLADFNHLKAWCDDQWHWCGIRVTLLDDEGDDTDKDASLWGMEESWSKASDAYHADVIQDLIQEIAHQVERSTYPVTAMGV
jgi:hypothetical protein